ncbi:MAG TPA: endonuclease/exonuclease/phosphatase family protein [Mesorhizobium sp.]
MFDPVKNERLDQNSDHSSRPARGLTLPRSLAVAIQRGGSRYTRMGGGKSNASVASYNIHKCVGTDGRFDPERTAKVVAEIDADLIALQEADQRTGDRCGLLDLAWLEKHAGLVPVHLPENKISHGWHGNLILARRGVIHHVHRLKLPGLEPRGAVIVDLELKGASLRIIAAHFGLLRRSRSQQAHAILSAADSNRPTIMLGDLNEWRVNKRSSLLNLLPHFGPIDAVVPSFPARFPLFALDRIMARPASLITDIEVHQSTLARVASDHLPLKARLCLDGVRRRQGTEGLAEAS